MTFDPFSNFEFATEEGMVAIGLDLEPSTLLSAYRKGVFPWPIKEALPLLWFCPPKRAILEKSNLHIPRSLSRAQKKSPYRFTLDQAFSRVIHSCAQVRREGQEGTWITPPMIQAYERFHQLGFAHSVEAWRGNELVGGIYGVDPGGAFAGESMFHLEPNVSKLALLFLMDYLESKGLDWIDIQVMTPHMEGLGAREISRQEFLNKLQESLIRGAKLF